MQPSLLWFSSPPLLLLLLLTPVVQSWRPWPSTALNTSEKYEGSSEFVHLRYHMGPVLTASITVHPIWYGRWSPSQKHIIRSFLRSISPPPHLSGQIPKPSVSSWWRTVRLYTDQTGANVSGTVLLGAEKSDRRLSHGSSLTRLTIQSVIRDAVTASKKPLPINPNGALYLVLTSPEITVEDFCGQVCGFHYFTFPSIVGYTLPYAWAGNSDGRCTEVCAYPFKIPDYIPGAAHRAERPPNGDVGVDGMISVIAHELAEVSSNPLVNAWYAGGDPCFPTEIADLCEGIYGTGGGGAYTGQLLVDGESGAAYNVNGVGGSKFLVQWIWNPVLNYCSGPNALDQ
ncbi:protein EXORDIUM-like 3 [Typha angustifolia]|uniref:protein EXORDIUM-like 3 n=1 Tax=Typha angustifolia TaxID=59011 RepID=UPI003C2CB48A